MKRILLLLLCFAISACWMVGPDFHEPPKNVAEHWLTNKSVTKKTSKENQLWWNVFRDPNLTALIQCGYQHNLSLQSAAAHVLQTRALLAQSVGNLYPQQQALTGNLTYNRLGGSSLQSILPQNFDTLFLGASSSWEIDFWGKYRRAILANDALFLASYAAYDNALVSLTADIAIAYIEIRTTEEQIRVTNQNVTVQALGLQIAKARFGAGQTSLLDVEQAQTELSQTQATIPALMSSLQHQKDILGVLLGTTPDKVDALLVKKKGIPKPPNTVAVGIPLEALAKRPDINQARMEAIAQLENIGATAANLYPSFSLTGTFGLSSNTINGQSLSEIFNWSNRIVTAGPTFTWPILNYGQITNAVRAQDATFQQAVLKYQNAVLQAQQEVQDHITEFNEMRKAERYLTTANNSALKSTKLAIVRYREGESDYTPVLDSERQQLSVQRSLTSTKGDVSKAVVNLYRSLGGGWQIRGCNDIVPTPMKADMAARTFWGDLLLQKNHQPPATETQQILERYLPNW